MQEKIEITRHNEKCERIGSSLNVSCFLVKWGLCFQGHDESELSTNRDNYKELASSLLMYDLLLAQHLDEDEIKATNFIVIRIDVKSVCSKMSQ